MIGKPAADFDLTIPVLIVGGGACGAVAGLAARKAGADALIVERDARPAGSTAMSQGLLAAAGTRSQAAHGIEDSGDIFFADIIAKTRGRTDPVIAAAIAHGSGPALDWLVDAHDLPWELDTSFRAAYGNSRRRVHGWPGHGGDDMIQLLHARLGAAGVDVVTAARLVAIVDDGDGRARGVEVERPGGSRERIGCDTLVLASGGFAANDAMVVRHMPEAAAARRHGHEGNTGDGIRLGAELGGALADMGSYQGYAMLTDPHGVSVPPGVVVEGGVIVNVAGRRFVDETEDIAGMLHPVMAQPGGVCWVVFDAAIEARCAHIPEMRTLIGLNAAKHAHDLAGLAAATGVDAGGLRASLAEAAAAQREGRADARGRIWGDDRPPARDYRALRMVGALYHTQGGLQIDGDARVRRADGTPLANLFAGGGAARGVSGPSSWGYLPAMGLCAAVTLGRLAGLAAARQALATSRA